MTEPAATVTVPALLSVAAAGQVLGCSARTVRRRIADGSLPAVLERDRTMIRGDELRAYIEGLSRLNGSSPARQRRRAGRHNFDFLTD